MNIQEQDEIINGLVGNVIGISGGELFIFDGANPTTNCAIFNVVRPVSKFQLSELRGEDFFLAKEQYRDLWVNSVQEGITDDGLDTFIDELLAQSGCLTDDEAFPFKDCSFCECFDENADLRQWADEAINDEYGYEVGTWEASGCFNPTKPFTHIYDTYTYNTLKNLGLLGA